jgi:hypothetical protein
LGLHGQTNGFGPGRLFGVKSQELPTSKLHCRGDMKQVSTAAPDSLVVVCSQFLRRAQHVGPINCLVDQQRF